ncbi:protein hinderin-like [Pipistrellus kuhlii]|uniref:protein hinderin-like n=1 Tax=Pipistrellus kuhlii TaxID=59472 RepID=UPI00174EF080|nr:protein hinderin-like [Pipistrellus kuhlii]
MGVTLDQVCCSHHVTGTSSSIKTHQESTNSGETRREKKTVGFHSPMEDDALWTCQKKYPLYRSRLQRGMMTGVRKYVFTSPMTAESQKELVSSVTSSFQHDSSWYEAALLDLAQSLSQKFASRPQPHPCRETSLESRCLQLSSLKSTWKRMGQAGPAKELQENQLLEDTFFIRPQRT